MSSLMAWRSLCRPPSSRLAPLLSASSSCSRRPMASHPPYYVKGGSTPTGITEEVRDLIRNRRHAENVDEWKRGIGIQDPLVLDMQDPQDIDDDQTSNLVYYPHQGEDVHGDASEPSPVLLVKRVGTLRGEPYYNKEICERLGLGKHARPDKVVVVPNVPSMSYKLYAIKHLVELVPVTFPMGFPTDEEFDPKACRINHRGEFYYHPYLKVDKRSMEPDRPMLLNRDHTERVDRKNWDRPQGTPLGTSNHHRNYKCANPITDDFVTDQTMKNRFSE